MQRLPLRHAVALGLLHGPTELLPVSSSGHTTLVPWLAGWPYTELDPKLRKSFEVALHAGTAAALLLRPPWRSRASAAGDPVTDTTTPKAVAKLGFLASALIPPALAGYTLGDQIERRLGTPATIACGLLAGSAATIAADLCAGAAISSAANTSAVAPRTQSACNAGPRTTASAGPRDGLALGVAQAIALMPGVSRSGASLAAARARGFSREEADRLSWKAGLPVIAGAALLKGVRVAREGVPSELLLPLGTGVASALLSTLVSVTALTPKRRAALLPACSAYRGALALHAIRRVRDNNRWQPPPIPNK